MCEWVGMRMTGVWKGRTGQEWISERWILTFAWARRGEKEKEKEKEKGEGGGGDGGDCDKMVR